MRPSSRNPHCVIDRVSLWASAPVSARLPPKPLHVSNSQYPTFHLIPNRPYYQLLQSSHKRNIPTKTTLIKNPSRAMSSDDAYLSFLDKANQDLNAGRSQQAQAQSTDGGVRTETVHANLRIPAPLQSVDAYYISETDEPFEPVVLKWEGAKRGIWPGASQFSNLISPSADLSASITTLSPSSFDPKNQYTSALRAVRAAVTQSSGGGESGIDESSVDVKVYQVEVGRSSVEYWVLALDAEERNIVGLRAKAIES